MLCSFKYQKRHYFLFPAANSKNLAGLLTDRTPDRPAQFLSDKAFIAAIEGLSSALHALHDFTSERLQLRLTGCHHDLAPRNILVHGDKFLIADFGLSSLKDIAQNSSTSFKEASGHYIAPECQDLDGTFRSKRISRKSDIWSFGCILLELLVYKEFGVTEVEEFEKNRTFAGPKFQLRRFHYGPQKTSPAVLSMQGKLTDTATEPLRQLVELTKQMLSLDPHQRPDSAFVHETLQHINVQMQNGPIDESSPHDKLQRSEPQDQGSAESAQATQTETQYPSEDPRTSLGSEETASTIQTPTGHGMNRSR